MREYFVNADFDLSLRPNRKQETVDGRGQQASEMPFHLLFFGTGGDSVLVDAAPDEDFLAYLVRAGLSRPVAKTPSGRALDAQFVPFGWNEEAAEVNRSYTRPAAHPPLDIVKRVNGRRFAANLEGELFDGDETLGVFDSLGEIEACIASRPPEEKWLLKSEHGNAGLGNRRVHSSKLSQSDREVVRRLLVEDSCVLLEKWRNRLIDIATVFEIARDGTVKNLFAYEVVNTADGAYIGSIFDHQSEPLSPWVPGVTEVALKVAERLAEEAYFGPVCLDHFVWSEGKDRQLRSLSDLNARLQVSAPILRLWRSWGSAGVFYWRLFASRKLRLPTDYYELESALGGDAFDAMSRRGILVTSPFDAAGKRLRRFGVLLAGDSRTEVEEMDRRLRERFEK
ncbi:MAG: hypothetical protein IFJ97_05615 [Acidobacteria bacterium]|uniref:ATP-grasp domain-containing protein n=1 Tax=Candidatus Sulfomarinibacter kjeldsenii TaxID=2885994 RepID=A0A8J6Y0U4_9BACT|nr:hypothetical protein [Candidatus Sulfomarinibacter kjeldsenii]